MTTRLALVGVGRWGRRLLPELCARFDVTACCTTGSESNVAWIREHFRETSWTSDLDGILADARIDAVAIATPISTHAELAGRALEAGKHVFVEKPLAESSLEASMLSEIAEKVQRVLFVGDILLYHPLFEHLVTLSLSDPVVFARLSWRKLGTFSSDILWNLGAHQVSLALALMNGRPVECEVLAQRAVVTDCDMTLARLRFDARQEVLIEVDRVAPRSNRAIDVATRSGAFLVWEGETLSRLAHDSFEELARSAPPLGFELDAFRRAVELGSSFPSNAVHATAVVETVERLAAERERRG